VPSTLLGERRELRSARAARLAGRWRSGRVPVATRHLLRGIVTNQRGEATYGLKTFRLRDRRHFDSDTRPLYASDRRNPRGRCGPRPPRPHGLGAGLGSDRNFWIQMHHQSRESGGSTAIKSRAPRPRGRTAIGPDDAVQRRRGTKIKARYLLVTIRFTGRLWLRGNILFGSSFRVRRHFLTMPPAHMGYLSRILFHSFRAFFLLAGLQNPRRSRRYAARAGNRHV
jgi:hypothetical protein